MNIASVKKFFLDLLFPAHCLSCGAEGEYLCFKCADKIETFSSANYFICGKRLPDAKQCEICAKKTAIKRIYTALLYKDELAEKMIKAFKYRFVFDLAKPLSKLLIRSLCESGFLDLINGNFVLIPVPLHKKRLSWRGFNQAELIAREISREFNMALETDVLKKINRTKPQSELLGEERKNNVKGTFLLNSKNKHRIKGKTVVLIDDIKTSGATLQECALVLKEAGARAVWAATLAK